MKKTNKFFVAAAGAIAGLSILPAIATYAVNPDTTTVTATVGSSISITATGGTISSSIVPGQSGTATVNLAVSTNTTKGFSVTVTGGALTKTSGSAHSIAASTSAAAGTEGWYIENDSGAALAPSLTADTIWTYNAPSGNTNAISTSKGFDVLVGTASSTPNGTYSGVLTFTAAATVE